MPLPDTGSTGIIILALVFMLPTGAWAQQHFTNCLPNNVDDANVVIPTSVSVSDSEGEYTLDQGDEIALISNDDRCAGMATVDTSAAAVSISVADVDTTAGVVEAYESNERLKYKIWRKQTGEVVEVSTATYQCKMLSQCTYGAQFTENGIYEVSVMSTGSGSLPVELVSFEATRRERTVVLNWRTESESQNTGFQVQHSAGPSAPWSTLSFIEGAGTTTKPQTYRYKAKRLEFGTHRFRLKHVHQNGTKSSSKTLKVELRLDESHAISEVAPNPVHTAGTINISVKESQHVTVHLYDVLGRQLATLLDRQLDANQTRSVRIRADRRSGGQYFVQIQGDDFAENRRVTIVK